LMRHLREVDGTRHTVIMIQVENEIGIFQRRDQSAEATRRFNEPVSSGLVDYLVQHQESLLPETRAAWGSQGRRSGATWGDMFGDSADEIFMAWQFGGFVEGLTKAGKAEYPLPMFVNCWIKQADGDRPGKYPSGGPISAMHDIWRAAAPSIDCLAIDIYKPDFKKNADLWKRGGNPFLVPETRNDRSAISRALYTFGAAHGIGFGPFGVEDMAGKEIMEPLYAALGSIHDLILTNRGRLRGAMLGKEETETRVEIGNCVLVVSGKPEEAAVLAIELEPKKILLLADSAKILPLQKTQPETLWPQASFSRGAYRDGKWVSDGTPPVAGPVDSGPVQYWLLQLP